MSVRRLALMCCLLLSASWILSASPAQAAVLSDDVRGSVLSDPVKPAVQNFVNQQIAKLQNDDLSVQQQAREALIAEVYQSTAPNALRLGRGFLDAYAEVLNSALLPMVKSQSPQQRLNVAIVVAKVAQRSNNFRLMPVTVELLKDPNEAIVLWGVRAAGHIFPSLFANNVAATNNPLMPAFMDAVKKYVRSPAVMATAYEALTVRDRGDTAVQPANWDAVVSPLAAAMLEVVEARLALYREGIPPAPATERDATFFLTLDKVWNAKHPNASAYQLRTVQAISDLIGFARQRLATASPTERIELVQHLIPKAAAALWVVSDYAKAPQLKRELDPLIRITPSMADAEITARADAVYPALTRVDQFKTIKPPASLGSANNAVAGNNPSTHPVP